MTQLEDDDRPIRRAIAELKNAPRAPVGALVVALALFLVLAYLLR